MINAIGIRVGQGGGSGPSGPDGVPSNLVLTVISSTEISASFDSSSTNQDGYRLYMSSDNGDTYSIKATGTGLTLSATGLVQDSYYLFYVVAYKGSTESVSSNIAAEFAGKWYLGGGINSANAISAHLPIKATSLANSYINEASPGTYDLTVPTAAPTWSQVLGWIFDGLSQYLATGITPANNQTWSIIIRYEGFLITTKEQCLAGAFTSTTKQFRISCGKSTATNTIYGSGQSRLGGKTDYSNNVAISGNQGYLEGVATSGTITAGSGTITYTITIGTMNYSSLDWYFKGNIKAIAIYNTAISLPQLLNVNYRIHNNDIGNLANRILYVNDKLSALVTWGMYTFTNNENPPGDLAIDTFAPTGLDVDNWLDACVAAGMKSACFTAKENDGFRLWDSSFADPGYSSYSINQTTWYANNGSPDITKLFVDGCRARGLKVGLCIGIKDKTHEARAGEDITTSAAARERYHVLIETDIYELLTKYGDLDYLWLDGFWAMSAGDVYYYCDKVRILNYIKNLQPNCVLPNNDQIQPQLRWEIEVYEVAQPAGRTPAGNTRLAEDVMSMRIDGAWYHHIEDDQTAAAFMTAADIKTYQNTSNSRTANLKLGIGVDKTGHLAAAQVTILEELGTL